MLIFFAPVLVGLFVYSYALIDPNLTLINHPLWVSFRDPLVYFGYYQRQTSTIVYILLLFLLFLFHWHFVKNYKRHSLWKIIGIISFFSVLSYPFLSHDLFNYIFDAKILTFYGDNPYTHIPGSYPNDEWIRFMHWTHRSYPYGPVFLPLTLVPSFLGFGKFILNFLFFKLLNFIFYGLGVYILNKMDKKWAMIFATSPLIIVEGLMNAHNDLIGVVLAFIGIYLLSRSKTMYSRIFFLASVGIKYLTLPVLFLGDKTIKWNKLLFMIQIGIVLYLSFTSDLRPWYFLTIFAFLPLFPKQIHNFSFFFTGLLISYYPFIRFGNWEQMSIKYSIVYVAFGLNIAYLLARKYYFVKK